VPLPPEPELEVLHSRTYEVKAYRKDANTMMLRGVVRDVKPAGLYVADDPEPLTIHHMVLDLDISFPSMEIVRVEVVFEDFPHATCPTIVPEYQKLVGLSIARGFTHTIRDLFGGPRGCTHVLALLQAMAPVTNQTRFSMMAATARAAAVEGTDVADGMPSTFGETASLTPEQRLAAMRFNLNTCHIWDEEGEHVQSMKRGEPGEVPVWITKRYAKLGRDASNWRSFTR
jgi:hypothetical protein